jgi:F-type H+-transporting ATPase subunit b
MEMAPNIPQLLTTVAGFVILIWILRAFAWGPILDLIDQRRAKIDRDYRDAERELKDAENLRGDFESRISEIKTIERERVQEAVRRGEDLAAGIVEKAHVAADEARAKGARDLELEAQKAQYRLRDDVVALAIGAAEKLMRDNLDQDRHRRLIEHYIDEIGGRPRA